MSEDTFIQIEETQAALRVSIEKTKELAAESDRLLRRRPTETASPKPAKPAR